MTCTKCSYQGTESEKFCPKCGSPLSAAAPPTVCPQCSASLAAGGKFCGVCGYAIGSAPQAAPAVPAYVSEQAVLVQEDPGEPPRKKKSKLWIPLCGVLLVALVVGGFFLAQNHESIMTMLPFIDQEDEDLNGDGEAVPVAVDAGDVSPDVEEDMQTAGGDEGVAGEAEGGAEPGAVQAQPDPTVPRFTGRQLEEIMDHDEYGARFVFDVREQFNNTVPEGVIFDQMPLEGMLIPDTGTVVIYVSQGPQIRTEQEVIDAASIALLVYYTNYLLAINAQDPDLMINVTPRHAERQTERIFGVNANHTFNFENIIIDLDTVEIDGDSVSFYAQFAFASRSRGATGAFNPGANIQLVEMIYDDISGDWLVDFSELVSGATIGTNRLLLQ